MGDFEKKFPASACPKKKIACSTNVIESLWEKKGNKYPAQQTARKKILDDQKSPTLPSPPSTEICELIFVVKERGGGGGGG